LTGRPQLLPYFGLGFHQCRWGYLTADELRDVSLRLDAEVVPHDVLWLDLDHTDNRKYFTFHPSNFRDPESLLADQELKKRKLVVLVDPHL
jgi:alpha 1,3-glucosidase